jgi:hypothetical protein
MTITQSRLRFRSFRLAVIAAAVLTTSSVFAQEAENADELAKKLSNPVSSLVSVPFQNNFDFGFANDGYQYKLNIQPVIPISLSKDWNLIARVIVPFIHQENVIGRSSQTGLSDTVASFFLSPAQPTKSGITWGLGPVMLVPTATEDLLGTEKWGAGPTAVILQQKGQLTYGALVNHIWSFAGESSRSEVNSTFLQPFFSVGLGQGRTITLNSESTYDWHNEQWTIPFNLVYSKVFKIGRQMLQWQIGGRVYAASPSGGPDWGIRAGLVLLFPK